YDLWECENWVRYPDEPYDINYHGTWKEYYDREQEQMIPEENEEEEVPEEWSNEVYTTQTIIEVRALFQEDDEDDGPTLIEESDSDSKEEIIALEEIVHPDERISMRYWWWKDLWQNLSQDTTHKQWKEPNIPTFVEEVFTVEEKDTATRVKKLTGSAI